MQRLIAIFVMLIGSVSYADADVLLRCKFNTGWERYYLLEPNQQRITLIGTDEGVVCTLKTKPHLYEWRCDGTTQVPAQVGKVNRYTGEYETEWGKRPFGQFRDGNAYAHGACTQEKAERLF